jgi:hypothetical protein
MSASRIFNGKRVDERNEFITLREGELSVDLCNLNIYVHDGYTPGGRQVGTGAAGQNGVSITGALINDAGHLILTKSDNTTIDAGNVVGPSGTGTNVLSTGTGTFVAGFGLQTNPDGTISVNSATIQSLLPILEINTGSQQTTQITNNLLVQGLISAHALTVTNGIIFSDGSVLYSALDAEVQTIAVSNIAGSTVTNETNEVSAIRFDTAGFTVTDIGLGAVKVTAISSGTGTANIIQAASAPTGNPNTLWYDTVGGRTYVWFDNLWIDASPDLAPNVLSTSTLINNGYSLGLDSAGVVNLPTFAGSPSIAIVQTASAGIDLNVNGAHFNFGMNGHLTWPNSSVQTGASISIADLKTIITTCTSFTEFKNAILGL